MLHAAIHENNKAVRMIERGLFVEAINVLKLPISGIKEGLNAQGNDGSLHEKGTHIVEQLILQSSQSHLGQDENVSPIYTKAVHIPFQVAASMDTALSVVSAVLVFNLALALNMLADETVDKTLRDSRLLKALSLYRLVVACDTGSTLLYMIVLNNAGLIHRRLDDRVMEQECFNELLAVWLESPVLYKQHMEGMASNIMGWRDGVFLAAAAA
eukprot:scaffold2533_cov137-Cylindrotheca_fusiformis.AAC.24